MFSHFVHCFVHSKVAFFPLLRHNFVMLKITLFMRKLILSLLLGILFITPLSISADELIVPVDENGDPDDSGRGKRHRVPPMVQWCTIDTDARTVTTTFTDFFPTFSTFIFLQTSPPSPNFANHLSPSAPAPLYLVRARRASPS